MKPDALSPQGDQSPDLPEVPLTPAQRALRDHITAAFPSLESLGHRGELTLLVPPGEILEVLDFCRNDVDVACELLSDLHAVHWPGGRVTDDSQETTGWPLYTEERERGVVEVDYIVRSISRGHWFRLRVLVPDDAAELPSATSLYASANFMEREVYDMMGVTFTGHPALTRIHMPEDWDGHPHRKDYPLGGVEVMYKGKTVAPPDERDY